MRWVLKPLESKSYSQKHQRQSGIGNQNFIHFAIWDLGKENSHQTLKNLPNLFLIQNFSKTFNLTQSKLRHNEISDIKAQF